MAERPDSTSDLERPLYFSGGEGSLFGILTRPETESTDVGVVLMTARGTYHRNRLSVRTARRLSANGFRVIRFDFQGVGESPGTARFELASPLVDNVAGAVEALAAEGSRRFVLIGSCFGARSALAAADAIDHLEGLVLAVMPFGDPRNLPNPRNRKRLRRTAALAWRGLLDRESRGVLAQVVRAALARRLRRRPEPRRPDAEVRPESNRIEGWLDRLIERKVPMLLLFGAEDEAYAGFKQAVDKWPESLRSELDRLLEIRVASHQNIHGHAGIDAQDWLLEVVEEWMLSRSFGATSHDDEVFDSPGPASQAPES